MRMGVVGAAAGLLTLGACAAVPDTSAPPSSAERPLATIAGPAPTPPAAPHPPARVASAERAADADVVRAADLPPIAPANAAAALAAFRLSCPALRRRTDLSGLTRAGDWDAVCAQAERTAPGDAGRFLASAFVPVRIGDGRLFATGYYEPELAGSRDRRPGYDVPLYAKPDDLVDVDLGRFSTGLAGKRIRGRMEGGALVPYDDRAAIEGGALDGRARAIAWGADPIDVFFLQIQGSGRLRLPDGGVMRVGYAGQNGHDYVSIGRLLIERGELRSGEASMGGIVGWLRGHPAAGAALMRENGSYVFFRELTGPGPLGALDLPVTPGVSVAADPRFVPLGAPVWLSSDRIDGRADVGGVWVAQDTGGAIKGANRFDTFWGAGEAAKATAGGLSAHGVASVLLPPVAAARLLAGDR